MSIRFLKNMPRIAGCLVALGGLSVFAGAWAQATGNEPVRVQVRPAGEAERGATTTIRVRPATEATQSIPARQAMPDQAGQGRMACSVLPTARVEALLREHVARDLSIRLDRDHGHVALAGMRRDVAFPEYLLRKPAHNWTYHLNDVNSRVARVSASASGWQIRVAFEDEGAEIVGRCPTCVVGKDNRAPDIEWRDPELLLQLKPLAHQGGLGFAVEQVDVEGRMSVNGPAEALVGPVIEIFKRQIRQAVQRQVTGVLESRAVGSAMARAFQPEVARLGLERVERAEQRSDGLWLCGV